MAYKFTSQFQRFRELDGEESSCLHPSNLASNI